MRVSLREVGASTLVGAALLLGGNGLVTIAEQDVPSGLAALIIASVPLWVVLLRALFGDRASGGTLVGVAVGFAGVGILVGSSGGSSGGTVGGVLLLVLASLSWAGGSFFSAKLPMPRDPFVSTSVQMITGGIALLVASVTFGELNGLDPSSFSRGSLVALGYLVVFGSLLAFTAYTWLLNNAPISKVSTYAYVNPVVAVFLGWIVLSETITVLMLVGAAVIVASVAFIVRHEHAKRTAEQRATASASEDAEPDKVGPGSAREAEPPRAGDELPRPEPSSVPSGGGTLAASKHD